jgi:hypothetical protein
MTTMQTREQEALNAYLKVLQSNGADDISLERHREFLLTIFPVIEEADFDSAAYRDAVEHALGRLDKREWPFGLAVAREYFHFWIKDFKSIAALNAEGGFNPNPVDWQPLDIDLKALWKMLDTAKFATAETWPLKAYTLALRQAGADKALVDARIKLVKILLIRLREAPEKSNRNYRIVVDATVPLLENREMRRVFFTVVREFYHFWMGDPDAASRIGSATGSTSFV